MKAGKSTWGCNVMACIALGLLALGAYASPPADELQQWIGQHAIIVRSIDATDEDFRDLEPLMDAIGSARVVQLGEPSHGAGSSFAAKARLVKFLHQRMGFDVVAWESGLYDVTLAQAAMRSADEATAAAQKGILATWSAAAEVRPLFEYARSTQTTSRPLEMAGYDIDVTAPNVGERFAAELRAFVRGLRDQTLRTRATALAEQILVAHQHLIARSEAGRRFEAESIQAMRSGTKPARSMSERFAAWEQSDAAKLANRKEDVESLQRAAGDLLAMMREHRSSFEQVHGSRAISFMERVIETCRGGDLNTYERERPDRPTGAAGGALFNEGWNRRDALSAGNLRWLIQEGYPGRKIIVWAHNVHTMNAYYAADVKSIHVEPQEGGLTPSGVALAKWLGDDVYTIAMTSYAGEDGWGSAKPIESAAEGTLESRLHHLGKPYVFLDFRALDDSPGHPMRKPQSLRIDRYRNDTLTDLTQAFDAVLFLDRMAPAAPIRERSTVPSS
jgi:erythromycin esterase